MITKKSWNDTKTECKGIQGQWKNFVSTEEFEEVVAKSWKNKSMKFFRNLKEQGTSSGKKDSRQQPIQKAPLFCAWRNRRTEIFSQAGQSISNAVTEKRCKMLCDTSNLSIPELLSPEQFYRIHQLLAPLFSQNISTLTAAGGLKYFLKNWGKLTTASTILEALQGYNTYFAVQPEELKVPRVAIMLQQKTDLIDQEIREILSKSSTSVAKNLEGQFLTS